MEKTIVVTGASGFVGRHLVAHLRAAGRDVRPVVRTAASHGAQIADLEDTAAWPTVLEGADTLVHLAAHNPRRGSRAAADGAAFRRINVEATGRLAAAAAAAGLARFVFVSSVRVYGDAGREPLTEDDAARPADPYGASKRDGEMAIAGALADGPTDFAILRPPVVYGRGRGGVFGVLDGAVRRGIPLPLGRLDARRSVIYVGNLVAAIEACLDDPRAGRRIFNVADGPAQAYDALMAMMAAVNGGTARTFAVPPALLAGLAFVPRVGPALRHALRPCVVDDSAMRKTLGWRPPYSTAEGIARSFSLW